MIFIVLNLILTAFLIGETVYVDRVEGKKFDGTNPAITNVLLLAVSTGLFTLFYCVRGMVTPSLFTLLMRVCLMIEGCMLVNIAFCFPYYAWKYSSGILYLIKFAFYVLVGFFVFFKFKSVTISPEAGIVIESEKLFQGSYGELFGWTWENLFDAVFRYIMPFIGCLSMLIKNEMNANRLDRHKGIVYTVALVSMWVLIAGLKIVSRINPAYALLHYYIYVPLLLLLPYTSWLTQAPGGRGVISFSIKAVFLYFIPSVLVGIAFMWIFHLANDYGAALAVVGIIVMLAVVFVGRFAVKPLVKIGQKFRHSSDYEQAFEQDLASIDYSGEMDAIANNMYQIFNKHVESTSMAVYINGGNNTFECAYTSNGKKLKIDEYEQMFESLLNIGKNVVIYNEVESLHALSGIKRSLEKFFKLTAADAMFVLNEGRDVHGIILLGAKPNNDHYKEYDLNAFTKLYSYFFVFGYYMRNISNKEIIGTVNRELKMSSQIISSIQENMDLVKNPKMDAGCVMIPAHNIGGEFVDMIRLTDTRHLFVVGDLSGKGIAASMSMVILKAIIRAYLAETHDFKQLVVKINQFVRNNLQKGTIFAGMFAIVNFENDTLYYINCGIPAIFLYTEVYNNVIEIQGSGHILGFVKDISPYISVKQMKLHKNDLVFTCTDGLIESHSLRGEQFGKDRIQRSMVANAMYPASRMARFAYDELVHFMSHEMEDDVSVLVMKYLKDNESEKESEKESENGGVEAAAAETEQNPEPKLESETDAESELETETEGNAGSGLESALENSPENNLENSFETAAGENENSVVEEEVPSFDLPDMPDISSEISAEEISGKPDETETESSFEESSGTSESLESSESDGDSSLPDFDSEDFDIDNLLSGLDE